MRTLCGVDYQWVALPRPARQRARSVGMVSQRSCSDNPAKLEPPRKPRRAGVGGLSRLPSVAVRATVVSLRSTTRSLRASGLRPCSACVARLPPARRPFQSRPTAAVWLTNAGGTERGRRLGEPGRCKHRRSEQRERRGAQRVPGVLRAGRDLRSRWKPAVGRRRSEQNLERRAERVFRWSRRRGLSRRFQFPRLL